MLIAWAFIVMSWNSYQPLLQVGPFMTMEHCQEAKQTVESTMVSTFAPRMGTVIKTSDCFKVVINGK